MTSTFVSLLSFISLSLSFANAAILSTIDDIGNDYDYVVVGGGTAGSAVANRLTEDSSVKVLVIEAGYAQTNYLETYIPYNCTFLTPHKAVNWNFTTEPQEGFGGRFIDYPRGYVLGGSSVINYMLVTRGSSDDWDRYAKVTGDDGWSWDQIFPYFKKNEKWTAPNDNHNTTGQFDPDVHGFDGIVSVSLAGYPSAIDDKVMNATQELGGSWSFNLDQNSGNSLGVGWNQAAINKSKRHSASSAYLSDDFLARDNLDVVLGTRVTRLLQSNNGSDVPEFLTVQYQVGDGTKEVSAKKEVILSAGAVMTPHILLHSGIGDKSALESLGIESLVDLPDVGQNLTDHPLLANSWEVASTDTRDNYTRDPALVQKLTEEWLNNGTGEYLVTSPLSQVGFFKIPEDSPAYQLGNDTSAGPNSPHFEWIANNAAAYALPGNDANYIGVTTAVVSPSSRGTITINSTNPLDNPVVDPALLKSDYDKAIMVEAIKNAAAFLKASAFDGYVIGPVNGLQDAQSDDDLRDYAMANTATVYHPVGTAAMSAKDATNGVVDPDLLLKKASGVRVVDASIFPYIPSAHTMMPVYAVAERAADLIKAKHQ